MAFILCWCSCFELQAVSVSGGRLKAHSVSKKLSRELGVRLECSPSPERGYGCDPEYLVKW